MVAENSLEAVQKALACKVGAIEVDIRVSQDGVVVLNHDSYIRAQNGIKLPVATHTYQRLLRNKKNLTKLDDTFKMIDGRIPLILDIKPDVPLEPVFSLLRLVLRGKQKPKNVWIASFDYQILKATRVEFPQLRLIVTENWSTMRAIYRAKRLKTRHISLNQWFIWGGLVASLSGRGWKIYAFTINNPNKAERWKKNNLYGFFTDYPEVY